ncbi:DNA polymerase III subunit gamma/tau [Acinetobacter sp. ANC 4558]|uniref:DNA polymerase III subunit gamma/tau n=1 Tax=Acinetobacter sp. ANC 4558 TaxID=1977876 RepID=UPI000A32BE6C|nr:DNA polymerase III subunit gamma/tau [Acinetobacter sp. ANC 4558]OTG87016.1 DNA polymerase III subunit gamma/tau [Acinetobacter sp. ANC 4558]
MYQVLARKYRPRNFNELVGQNHVSRALTSALERGRLHHAYLFTGTRGVGKTTIARILAKCLNCETGITSTPCEVCPTCKAVNEGRFIDLIEIDAASRTKVEDTRELLDNVPYAPTQGRFKVYLIDEVHMLSTHSFNALLKTLEEPPEHVKFLFATTDPQKLPITVISRCLQFTLRPLAVDEITEHLTLILNKESIPSDQDAIWQIAESAQGSLRDALSLTDQAIAYGQGKIHHQDVKEMLGLIDRTIIYDLILSIHQNQKSRVSELLLQFRQQALDVSLVLDQLISTLHELALLQYLPDLSLKYSAEINKKIMYLSQLVAAPDLQLYYQIACKGRADLQLAVTQEQGFEMCILRLLAFKPIQPNEVILTTTAESEKVEITESPKENIDISIVSVSTEKDITQADSIAIVSEVELEKTSALILTDDSHDKSNLTEQITTSDSAHIIFDATNETELFGLDAVEIENTFVSESQDDSLFEDFSPIITNKQEKIETAEHTRDSRIHLEVRVEEESNHVIEEVLPDLWTDPKPIEHDVIIDLAVEVGPAKNTSLMPQEILSLQPEVLEGEWNISKWEYWFRNSQLSPAVQELAQHGVMTGFIDGESIFNIPEKYQQLLNQLQDHLEQALKSQWEDTLFQVNYTDLSNQVTPYYLLNDRKQKAFQRATELLQEEPVVKNLLATFEGELQDIQLK